MAWFAQALQHMSRTSLLIVLALCAVSRVAGAQPWAEAYKAGDYAKAASLLQPIVIEQQPLLGTGEEIDPAPTRHLAVLYARGAGVARDDILACTLAELSDMAVHMRPPRAHAPPLEYIAGIKDSEEFVIGMCGGLSNTERLAASRSLTCLGFGLGEGTLGVGGQSVRYGRLGLRLAESAPPPFANSSWCPLIVHRLAVRTVEPPADAAPGVAARSFVELLAWRLGGVQDDPTIRYALTWTLFALRNQQLVPASEATLLLRSEPPVVGGSVDVHERLHVEMIRSGHIRWRLDGTPPKRGWIMLTEKDAR